MIVLLYILSTMVRLEYRETGKISDRPADFVQKLRIIAFIFRLHCFGQ